MTANRTDTASLDTSNPRLSGLRQQLLAVVQEFAGDDHDGTGDPLAEMLSAVVDDIHRATTEPLEIFPVCHHSPASAVHCVRRLKANPPRVVFIELCEDLRPLVQQLADCKLPVALQAFAHDVDTFPERWSPLSVVAPITEFSAEYQAMAFCLQNPSTELVFVDRSVDHLFQWLPQTDEAVDAERPDPEPVGEGEDEEHATHGEAVGVQMGALEPTFDRFREFLLKNAQVQTFAEWWDQYVEQAVIGSDYETYREVFCLVGSILRRLGLEEKDRTSDERRERFMWQRMRSYLAEHDIAPTEALHICGAIHAVSDIPEFGSASDVATEIEPTTRTHWLYGVIPSSYMAIEHQFGHPHGTVTLANASWDRARKTLKLQPFTLGGGKKSKAKTKTFPKKAAAKATGNASAAEDATESDSLLNSLTRPPLFAAVDEQQLLDWSAGIVKLARRNGYLSSTADAIAIHQTATLLANLRNRPHPSPGDFREAAITCLEKDRVPTKRNVARLCDILLGGNRSGQVGYTSLPPLAQDVYDRLANLDINLKATSIQRALIDFRTQPELLPCSDLLWKLKFLLADRTVRPIMGKKELGHVPSQESWDIEIGKRQAPLIQLGYEGVTVEQVLEKRLKSKVYADDAGPVIALEAAEESILYLKSVRLTDEIGRHACAVLLTETGTQSAPEIFERVRRLIHHYRSTPNGLPDWIRLFVTSGYSHYCTLLPEAFSDRGTTPEQLAGSLAFLFTLESLALSLGCDRQQLVIAVRQSGPVTEDPQKLGLLWTAEWLLKLRTEQSIRDRFEELLENPLALPSVPGYVSSFLLALKFTPVIASLTVELLTKVFERLPNDLLLPWLPGLLHSLRDHADDLLPTLLREADRVFPGRLADLSDWEFPWDAAPPSEPATPSESSPSESALTPDQQTVRELLFAHPETTNALAAELGLPLEWQNTTASAPSPPPSDNACDQVVKQLLLDHPETMTALAKIMDEG